MRFSLLAAVVAATILIACGSPQSEDSYASNIVPDTVYVEVPAQEEMPDTANLGPNEWVSVENGQVYVMKQYYIAFLKKGPNRDQDSATTMQIQAGHLGYLDSVYALGQLDLNGPTGEGEILGFSVYDVSSIEEARAIANGDPAVKAGRLVVEVHPWWALKGGKLD